MSHSQFIKLLVVDFHQAYPLLRSIASAYAISQNMDSVWRPSDVYYLPLPGATGSPGTWEVKIPNPVELRRLIDEQTLEVVSSFVRASFKGSEELTAHLNGRIKIRDKCLDNIQYRMAEFNHINAQTLSGLNASVRLLKTGRFVNNIAMITTGVIAARLLKGGALWTAAEAAEWVGGGAVGVAGAPLLKSLSVGIAKDWEESKETTATQVAFESGKTATSEAISFSSEKLIEKQFKIAVSRNMEAEAAEAATRQIESELRRMKNLRIGGQSRKGQAARAAKIKAKQGDVAAVKATEATVKAEVNATVKSGTTLARVGKVIKIAGTTIFTCWDLYDAFAELKE